ncbi:MAG: aminoglycoside adenylyltransferase [Chloroflexi bacterium]|nr:aminoglycoside adenylyltransferase [Chloroflexota bacterium]
MEDRKEVVSKEDLTAVLDLLEGLNMRYWVDGGWGVDVLTGRQNRDHRDVDIDFDGAFAGVLLDALKNAGYEITTDWSPSRIELHHPDLGYLDIHPLIINEGGSAKQADPNGGWYHFEARWFSCSLFEGRVIPCISAEAQKLFHTGYELRETDCIDIQNLESAFPDLFS